MAPFTCPHCGIPLEVGAELSAQTVACPSCQGAIRIPDFAGAESENEKESYGLLLIFAWFAGHIPVFLLLAVATGTGAAVLLAVTAVAVEVGVWKRHELAAWVGRVRRPRDAMSPLSRSWQHDPSFELPSAPRTSETHTTGSYVDVHVGAREADYDDELVEVRPARNSDTKLRHQTRARWNWPNLSTVRGPKGKPLNTNAPKKHVKFFGEGSKLDLGFGTLDSPLVFSTACPQHGQFDSSLIDASLHVAPHGSDPVDPLPYWPSYYDCSPSQRACYLDWLLEGRRAPSVELGYVFIYFYGLERRVVIDRADFIPVAREILALLPVYSYSNSFRRYATALLWRSLLLAGKKGELSPLLFDEAVEGTERWNDDVMAMALATVMYLGCSLPVALAVCVCQHDPRSTSSVVVRRHKDEFRRLFSLKYEAAYDAGLTLRASKRRKKLHYHPASATLMRAAQESPSIQAFEVPNVLGLSSQFKGMIDLWEQCVDELKGYSRVARKTDGEMTAEVFESLPEELREGEHPETDAWMKVWETNVDEEGWPIVPASELAAIKGFEPRGTLTKSQCTQLLSTAEAVGLGVEPDARITGKNYKWDERLTLFFLEDDTKCDVASYLPASVLLRLGATVAQADGQIDPEELQFIAEHLEGQFDLSDADAKRLERLQYLLLHSQSGDNTVTKTLAERLTRKQRLLVGEFLVGVAAVDKVVTTDEVKALRKAYRSLRLEASDLDELLAQHASASLAPVTAESAQPAGELRLNMAAVSRIMTETREVAAVLRQAMAEERADDGAMSSTVEPPSSKVMDSIRRSPLPSTGPAQGAIKSEGLDAKYEPFLRELTKRQEWPASALRDLADQCGVMVSGAIEAVNEWALDTYGDWLIEEGDPYRVRIELLTQEV